MVQVGFAETFNE